MNLLQSGNSLISCLLWNYWLFSSPGWPQVSPHKSLIILLFKLNFSAWIYFLFTYLFNLKEKCTLLSFATCLKLYIVSKTYQTYISEFYFSPDRDDLDVLTVFSDLNLSCIPSLCLLLFWDFFTLFPTDALLSFLMNSDTSTLPLAALVVIVNLDLDFNDPLSQIQSTAKGTFCTVCKMSFKCVGWPLTLLKYPFKSTVDSQPLCSLSYFQTSSHWRELFIFLKYNSDLIAQ